MCRGEEWIAVVYVVSLNFFAAQKMSFDSRHKDSKWIWDRKMWLQFNLFKKMFYLITKAKPEMDLKEYHQLC